MAALRRPAGPAPPFFGRGRGQRSGGHLPTGTGPAPRTGFFFFDLLFFFVAGASWARLGHVVVVFYPIFRDVREVLGRVPE